MTDDNRKFLGGALTGLAAAAVLVQVWLAVELGPLRRMYAEMAGSHLHLPVLTRLCVTPLWLWGMPLIGAGEIAALVWRRPRKLVPYLLVALAAVAVVLATYHFAEAPIHELAGAITE